MNQSGSLFFLTEEETISWKFSDLHRATHLLRGRIHGQSDIPMCIQTVPDGQDWVSLKVTEIMTF